MDKTRRCRAALHCAAAQSRPVGIEARPEDDLTGSGEGQASKTGSQRRRAGAGCRRGRAKGGMRQRGGLHPLQVRHHSQSDPWDREDGRKRAANASVTVCLCRAGAHCCMNARGEAGRTAPGARRGRLAPRRVSVPLFCGFGARCASHPPRCCVIRARRAAAW